MTCANERDREKQNRSLMKLFPVTAPLEYVTMDVLDELITTPRGNRDIFVIVDRFSKLIAAIPMNRHNTEADAPHPFY